MTTITAYTDGKAQGFDLIEGTVGEAIEWLLAQDCDRVEVAIIPDVEVVITPKPREPWRRF